MVTGGFLLGYLQSQRLGGRAALLEEGALGLERGARMLLWQATPLPELMGQLEEMPGQLSPLFRHCRDGLNRENREQSFSALWEEGVSQTCGILTVEEQRMLQTAGGIFGQYEREEQAEALKAVASGLRETARQVRDGQRRLGRMYCVLGSSVGILLTILLL